MSKYPLIAREGWIPIGLALMLSFLTVFKVGLLASLPAWLIMLLLVFIFRDPHRVTPSKPLAVISPVQASVILVDKTNDPWLERQATRIRLKMSPLDLFALHSPLEGKVMKQWYAKPAAGGGLNADFYQSAHWIKTDEGDDAVMVIYTRHLSSRLRCKLRAGERVGQGQRCGLVYFGAEVEVFLAENTRVQVGNGDKVVAGSSILGELVHLAEVSATTQPSSETSAV